MTEPTNLADRGDIAKLPDAYREITHRPRGIQLSGFNRSNSTVVAPIDMNQCAAGASVYYFAAELVLRDGSRERYTAAGKYSAPIAKAWIKKRAWEIGLEGQELVGALAYAGNEGWITDGPQEGRISLTSKGAATMRDLARRTVAVKQQGS